MKLKITAVVLMLTLLFSSNATASFMSSTTTSEVIQLISKLSDDIGVMADRIDDMADKILVMADKIGEMADRIVHTEQMMSDLTLDMASLKNSTSATQTLIITQDNGSILYANQIPSFTTSIEAPQMLIYVSSSLTIDSNTITVLVNNQSDLEAQWDKLKTLAKNDKIYIAVKTINGNTLSSLSNVLTYTTLF